MTEYRDLPWGDPKANWTPEQHQDWAEAEAELHASRWRPPQPVCEKLDTIPPAGIDKWTWICTESNFELPTCHAIDAVLLGAELRLVDREARGLVDKEDHARVFELRRARGRLN